MSEPNKATEKPRQNELTANMTLRDALLPLARLGRSLNAVLDGCLWGANGFPRTNLAAAVQASFMATSDVGPEANLQSHILLTDYLEALLGLCDWESGASSGWPTENEWIGGRWCPPWTLSSFGRGWPWIVVLRDIKKQAKIVVIRHS